MRIATTPAWLEACANHPRVRPYIGPPGEFFVADHFARLLVCEWDDGCFAFVRDAPGVLSAHLLFLPGAENVAQKCRDAISHAFRTEAHTVIATVPTRYRHVRRLCREAGLRHLFDNERASFWRLRIHEWA